MRNSVRFKFILGLSVILICAAVALNLLIRQIFNQNLENVIEASMKNIMRNSMENIYRRISSKDNFSSDKEYLDKVSGVLNESQLIYSNKYEIRNSKGEIFLKYSDTETEEIANKSTKSALNGKAVVNLKYLNDNVYVVLSYPLYYKDKCAGTISVSDNFNEQYMENKKIVNTITFIEIFIFTAIFIGAYLFTSKIVEPVIMLTKEIKKVEDGNYEINIEVKSKDEIGVLLREFINMKDKIRNQIETISREKDKVLKLEKGRREFFNNVTHELKTPLTAISGYAQILSEKNVQDEKFKSRAVERIYLESERLHKLVLDLLSISKGASFLEEEKKIINMEDILNDICGDMELKAKKYSMSISKSIEEGCLTAQENKIRQLIINILDNAIKYSFSGATVLVKAFNNNEFYIIEVTNHSKPIQDKIYKNVFDPFVRGKNVNEVGSSGLGLYICSEIIKEHNGEIYIENGDIVKVTMKIPSIKYY